jgi:hypothetical protein
MFYASGAAAAYVCNHFYLFASMSPFSVAGCRFGRHGAVSSPREALVDREGTEAFTLSGSFADRSHFCWTMVQPLQIRAVSQSYYETSVKSTWLPLPITVCGLYFLENVATPDSRVMTLPGYPLMRAWTIRSSGWTARSRQPGLERTCKGSTDGSPARLVLGWCDRGWWPEGDCSRPGNAPVRPSLHSGHICTPAQCSKSISPFWSARLIPFTRGVGSYRNHRRPSTSRGSLANNTGRHRSKSIRAFHLKSLAAQPPLPVHQFALKRVEEPFPRILPFAGVPVRGGRR